MDLNIYGPSYSCHDAGYVRMIKKAIKLGFTTIAINTTVDYTNQKENKIPEPLSIEIENCGKNIKILRRLTAIVSQDHHCHCLKHSTVARRYDIIAVEPKDEKILQHICGNMDIEIITVNMTQKLPYLFKGTYMNQAAERGIVFEINYATCLRRRATRRNFIANAQSLAEVTKKSNIIVSSGTGKYMELRGVRDVINMGMLFGLNRKESKECVKKVGEKVLAHSATRLKSGCGFVPMQEIPNSPIGGKWVVDICRVPKTTAASNLHEKKNSFRYKPYGGRYTA